MKGCSDRQATSSGASTSNSSVWCYPPLEAPVGDLATCPPCCQDIGSPSNRRHPLATALQLAIVLPIKIVTGTAVALTLKPMRALWGQTVPYSNRKHLVLLPECLERFLGEMAFARVCSPARTGHVPSLCSWRAISWRDALDKECSTA